MLRSRSRIKSNASLKYLSAEGGLMDRLPIWNALIYDMSDGDL
jgi:hypothetical protein